MSYENPYQAPPPVKAAAAADNPGEIGLIHHVRAVAALMIVQGALSCLFGGMMLASLALMFGPLKNNPAFANNPLGAQTLYIMYGVMGLGGLIPGALFVAAGIANFMFRCRTLGFVALGAGVLSIATFYCAPTAIALAIYGLIVYLNEPVASAFRLAAEGKTFDQIVAAAYSRK